MPYYKSSHPAVVDALNERHDKVQALWDEAKAFGACFSGEPYCLSDFRGQRFGGLKFAPIRDLQFWTVPDHNGGQRPRSRPRPGATDAQKAEHKQLREEWDRMYPKGSVALDPLFNAMGTDWGQLLFAGISFFVRSGTIYVNSGAKLGVHMTEILGSEYAAAQEES